MLTVNDYALIRQDRRGGAAIREHGKGFRRSPKKILKAVAESEPQGGTPAKPRPAPIFDAVRPIVDEILADDRTAPPKQRHTASQIFRRLVAEHHYTGSYHPVQRYLQQRRRDRRETFIPLDHAPGHRLE